MTDTIALHTAERAADDGIPVADVTAAGLTATPLQQAMDLARVHGPAFRRRLGDRDTLFVSSLDLVTELADENRFAKGVSVVLENVREFAGDGLFTAYNDEPNWAKAHEVLMPAFALGSMRTYHPAMLRVARRVMASWDRRVADGSTLDVAEDMTRMTLDTIGLAGFGFDFGSFARDTPHPFVEAMVRCLQWSGAKFARQAGGDYSAEDAAFRADADYLASVVDEVIAARTASGESGDDDLLGLMLGSRERGGEQQGLDLANIRNQVITFLIAGHETTSGALSFALYYLLKDPAALRLVQREADELWGDASEPDPSFEDIARLPYTRQVLNEALRLWPTAAAFTRQAQEDTLLGGRHPLKKGDLVTVLTPMLHRDPAWGDNPELFDPSRFTPQAEAARSPHAYKPFGTGERACIGRQFALHEATMLLALLAHRYRLIDRVTTAQPLDVQPTPLALLLLGREADPKSERGVECPGDLPAPSDPDLVERARAAKEKLGDKVFVLGHHYQRDEVIEFADVTGDSFKLARDAAARPDAEYIVFCGVHFMAESADILTGDDQQVILPDLAAGCSMADMATAEQVAECWDVLTEAGIAEQVVPVSYMNSSADIKAFTGKHGGTICTSSNAKRALDWAFEQGEKVLFLPDQHLGRNTAVRDMGMSLDDCVVYNPHKPGGGLTADELRAAKMILWRGHCSVHGRFSLDSVNDVRERIPGVNVLVHPECKHEVVAAADYVGSTEYIIKALEAAPRGSKWAIGTELNLVRRLANRFAAEDKEIVFLDKTVCFCSTMNRIDLPHLVWALESLAAGKVVNRIQVDNETESFAKLALERMLALP